MFQNVLAVPCHVVIDDAFQQVPVRFGEPIEHVDKQMQKSCPVFAQNLLSSWQQIRRGISNSATYVKLHSATNTTYKSVECGKNGRLELIL